MLKDILAIAEKHNIKVFPLYGTLLGIKRHGGFIPWDDDIDLAVFENDLEKLLTILKKELPSNYSTATWMDKGSNSTGNIITRDFENVSIGIDIFTILYVKNKNKKPNKFIYSIAKRYVRFSDGKGMQRFARILLSIRSKKHYWNRMLKLKDTYTTNKDTGIGMIFIDDSRITFDTNIFKDTEPVLFHGIKWYSPKNPTPYLESVYGDWKKIPSDKQKSKDSHYDL